MIQPWGERQRQSLRTLRHAMAVRAEREAAVAEGLRDRTRATEDAYAEARRQADAAFDAEQARARNEAEQARQQLQALYDGEQGRVELDRDTTKRAARDEYAAGKEALEADFQEARWTINTVYEADKKVAKDQFEDAQLTCKKAVETLAGRVRAAEELIAGWDYIDELPDDAPAVSAATDPDPWKALADCQVRSEAALDELRELKAPRYLIGAMPWVGLGLAWLVLSLPALLLPAWYAWLAATTIVVIPLGLWYITSRRRQTRHRVLGLWDTLRDCAARVKALQPSCIEQAQGEYDGKRFAAKDRQRTTLQQTTQATRAKLDELRSTRDDRVRAAAESAKRLLTEIERDRAGALRGVDDTLARQLAEAEARHEGELIAAQQAYEQARDESNRRHAEEWTEMLRDWKQGCDQFVQTCRTVGRESAECFPPWDAAWKPAATLPAGLRFGALRVGLDDFPQGVPQDPQLPTPDFSSLTFPALLPFPEKSSLLFKASGAGKAEAVRALQALLLHCWTSLPPGKVRATVIDPVGRGENFGAFMHLADHDENLVHGRIWTEPSQIEQRLSDLTAHMENVLQKYLRNQFQTLAEYNEQAGEVAEPFRFLVVADFPVNFTADACRRLISIASAGARCGVYTFVMMDTKQPLPQGIDRADLERACTCLNWEEDHFVWADEDFGNFALQLDAPPPPERCTDLLQAIGDAAKRAGRVEVPFDAITPPRDAWWTGDSRGGIAVPLGRVGARGQQMLQLGHGTSQHVLIAGKTGSGKSTLLHVLITQLALHYSPREIELYLVDFKKGVEFKSYANHALPHARVIAVESEREFGLSVLQRLDAELGRRGELFRAHGVNDVASFRKLADDPAGGLPPLPRVLLIVDEFQEFFVEDDKVAQESALLLDRLVRQGRAFGIHILLGSQTLGGAYSLARSTIDQMAVRVALQCSEADAHLILSRDNTEARLLSRPGEAIYNASHGLLEGNHLFQIVWLTDAKRDELLRDVHDLSRRREEFNTPLVFEGTAAVTLDQSPALRRAAGDGARTGPPWHAWLGDAVAIKDPTAAVFRKQSGCNLLMVGHQDEAALGLTVAALVAVAGQVDPATPPVLVAASTPDGSEPLLDALAESLPVRLLPQRELPALLGEWVEEMNRRLQGGPAAGPLFLCLHGLHRIRDLRRPDDDFGFGRKEDKPSPYRLFTQLLKDGPAVGIFTLVWCDTYTNLQRALDRPTLREFDQRVLLQMSASDSSSLMDSPVAAKLGPQRALFFTEDQGRIEKFRPYAIPTPEWVRGLAAGGVPV
jgi:energy-coupling factor transporter ATP-binding protein EcfA2